jgi:predicted  nucleic acid-binding Zn-ribbon protein
MKEKVQKFDSKKEVQKNSEQEKNKKKIKSVKIKGYVPYKINAGKAIP